MTHQFQKTASARALVNCLALACLATCFGGCKRSAAPTADQQASGQQSPEVQKQAPAAAEPVTARGVLESMVAAYKKAPSYGDTGAVRVRGPQGEKTASFSVTMVRPNKLRLHVNQAIVVSDGRQLHAAILLDVPNQVLCKDVPARLTLDWLCADPVLREALIGGFAGAPPQLVVLLTADPLKVLLDGVEGTALLEPDKIMDRDCHRVQLKWSGGTSVFWIDQETSVLRRVVARGRGDEGLSLVAEFQGARLGGEVDPAAFQFETPEGAKLVEQFVRPRTGQGRVEQYPVSYAKIAERSEPKTFKLTPLWKCTELKAPANVLAVQQPDGRPRLLVVDNFNSVAEVGLDGKVIAVHPLNLAPTENVNTLHTATGADGKRCFVALASGHAQQRCHLLDENCKLLLHYPEDALQHKHSGIADVQLADGDGDGSLEMCIGYRGIVGVHGVSPQGRRLWSNRMVVNVVRIAVAGPDDQRRRKLLCANLSGSLALIDTRYQRPTVITVPHRYINWIEGADLDGDGRTEWCGLAVETTNASTAIGLNLAGQEIWRYALPPGVHQQPIERIIPGRVSSTGPNQWLLPGPDGSIHILAADGKPIDRFNYGAVLCGLATTESDGPRGGRVLIVSSPQRLEAWKVE